MTALIDALRRRYKTPQEAMQALGLDADLLGARLGLDAALGGEEEDMGLQLSPKAALAEGMFLGHFGGRLKTGLAMDSLPVAFGPIFAGITAKNFSAQRPALDAALRVALKGKLANDAEIEEVTNLLKQIEGVEAGADTTTEANAGMPAYMREEPEDADDETPEEREEDEGCDARARDARDRLGRDERDDEEDEREEENEFKPDTSKEGARDARMRARDKARDAMRTRRADDARRRLGRDEEPEEKENREREEEAKDRREARDRRRMGRDYRRARDAHRAARDAHRRHANDWRRAHDAHKSAMDAKSADDAAKAAADMKRADDEARKAHDAMVRARDTRHRARDARRAHDTRRAKDENMEPRGDTVTKAAMDQAIATGVAAAVAANDRRHREIAEARSLVRVKAGDIAMDSGINTAADVFAKALDVLGVNYSGISDATALRRLYEVAPRRGGDGGNSGNNGFAHDAAPASASALFSKLIPGAASVERL